MNRITVLLIAILSIMNIARPALAQEIYAPVPQPAVILERSGAQKLVGTTTDITAVALPVATLAGVLLTGDWEGLRQGIYTAVAGVSAVYILKFSVREKRPDGSNYSSFPSMHSATAFGSAAFLQRRYGWKFGGSGVCACRLYGGRPGGGEEAFLVGLCGGSRHRGGECLYIYHTLGQAA